VLWVWYKLNIHISPLILYSPLSYPWATNPILSWAYATSFHTYYLVSPLVFPSFHLVLPYVSFFVYFHSSCLSPLEGLCVLRPYTSLGLLFLYVSELYRSVK
jgi:hypothetical protein